MTEVVLTPEEMVFATQVGARRRIRAIVRGRVHRHGYDGADNWTTDIEAALAECAVAKALKKYWTDDPDPDYGGDVGNLHVRATQRKDGCLILHRDDPPDAYFVLACGRENHWRIPGYIRAGAGQQSNFWRTDTGRPAFFVPQSELESLIL